MIFVTGDVHQATMRTVEQSYIDGSELDVALRYADILNKHGLAGTLFITGRAVRQEPEKARRLAKSPHIEVGGHTWSAFKPSWFYRNVQRLSGNSYGPKFIQRLDISRTLEIIKTELGVTPRSWRTHAYRSDGTTRDVLSTTSVDVISDIVGPGQPKRSSNHSLTELPINTMPDHEHLIHGDRTRKRVEELKQTGWHDAFSAESYEISGWAARIRQQVADAQKEWGIATVLAHPSCMEVADGLEAFNSLCRWISDNEYETDFCRNAPKYI
jgi:peptidoglycan/xylan/chitin deacetylase (PgdA/CDA1 family)